MQLLLVILAFATLYQDVTSSSVATGLLEDVSDGEKKVPKILNGEFAKPGMFPFIVSIQAEGEHFCGGTVISKYWVVSAAHCFQSPVTKEMIRIRSGCLKYGTGGSLHQVAELMNHPGFNEENVFDGDIALLKVMEPFVDKHVKPARLAAPNDFLDHGTKVISAGWGILTKDGSGGASQDLMCVTLTIVDRKKCNNLPGIRKLRQAIPELQITKNMICARTEGSDTTSGDSGGPLLHQEGEELVLVGIVSFGEGQGEMDSPGVYTDVAKYHKWIYRNSLAKEKPHHYHSRALQH